MPKPWVVLIRSPGFSSHFFLKNCTTFFMSCVGMLDKNFSNNINDTNSSGISSGDNRSDKSHVICSL